MALTGVVSVFLGWLIYYSYLKAIVDGAVKVNWILWSRGVGACSLLMANGAMCFIQLPHDEADWLVFFILWPIFALPMDAGYRLACSQMKTD